MALNKMNTVYLIETKLKFGCLQHSEIAVTIFFLILPTICFYNIYTRKLKLGYSIKTLSIFFEQSYFAIICLFSLGLSVMFLIWLPFSNNTKGSAKPIKFIKHIFCPLIKQYCLLLPSVFKKFFIETKAQNCCFCAHTQNVLYCICTPHILKN